MVAMAVKVSFGLESVLRLKVASPGAVAGCSGSASPTFSCAASSGRFGVGREEKFGRGGKGEASAEAAVRSRSSCVCWRARCAAEVKTCRSVEVDDESLDHKPTFRPPIGWPFSSGAPLDLHLVGRKSTPRVKFSGSPVILEEQRNEVGVSGVHGGSKNGSSKDLYCEWIATEFSAAVQSESPPPRQREDNSDRDNYYVNTGYAIRTLREELPNLFYKKLSFDIYRDDITFRDPMNTFAGIDNYKLIFWALRFHGRIFFKALWVDINRVWQPHDKVIMIRWTVRGIPRVPWEAQGHFEGTSEYKLDKDGKIYEHKVDNIIFNSPPPKYHALSVLDLVRVAGGQTTPTPSFCGKAALMFVILSPYLRQFTWVRFYWALKSTLVLNKAGDRCMSWGSTPECCCR